MPPGVAFVLSAGERESASFCGPSDAGAAGGVFSAGRAWANKAALVGGTFVTVGAGGGSVLTVAAAGSGFAGAAAGSGFSGRRGGAGATGDGAGGGLPGPLEGAVSVARTGAPQFGEALAGIIGGGIVARGCAGRSSA